MQLPQLVRNYRIAYKLNVMQDGWNGSSLVLFAARKHVKLTLTGKSLSGFHTMLFR